MDTLLGYPVYTECQHITNEWAKQLAHDIISEDLDFANMRVIKLNKTTCPQIVIPYCDGRSKIPFVSETIDINRVYCVLSREIHYIGYGPKTNTLVVVRDI